MIADTIHEHLNEVKSLKIKSLIAKATTIEPTDTLAEVINKIIKNNCYDVFYLKDKTILSTNIRSLLNAKSINTMKVESFLYPIRHVTQNDSVQKAANIILHYRIREVPVVDKNKIVGVIAAKQIIKLLSTKDNRWIKANLIYTKNPITISFDESVSSARRVMTSKRIDHLPVLKNNKISQVLTSYHILEFIKPQEKQGRKAMVPKTEHLLEFKIGNIGSNRIPQCAPSDDLNKIINLMTKTNTTCCLVNLWGNLQGIITYRDILGLLASKVETKIPLYIVGMPEDQNSNLINSKFTKTLKRLQQVYSEIQEARVSIKQQRVGNRKEGIYEVNIMITTPHHSPLIHTSVGFDLSEVLEELGEKLLKTLSKKAKKRSKDSIRKISEKIF